MRKNATAWTQKDLQKLRKAFTNTDSKNLESLKQKNQEQESINIDSKSRNEEVCRKKLVTGYWMADN